MNIVAIAAQQSYYARAAMVTTPGGALSTLATVTMTAIRKPAAHYKSEPSTAFPSLHEGRVPANDPLLCRDEPFRIHGNVTVLLAAICALVAIAAIGYVCFRAGVAYWPDVAAAGDLVAKSFRAQSLLYSACIGAFAVLVLLFVLEHAYIARLRDRFAMAEHLSPTEYTMSVEMAEHLTGRKVPASYLDRLADPAALTKFWADADAQLRYLRADAALRARRTKPRTA